MWRYIFVNQYRKIRAQNIKMLIYWWFYMPNKCSDCTWCKCSKKQPIIISLLISNMNYKNLNLICNIHIWIDSAERKKSRTDLFVTIFVMVLSLDKRAEEQRRIVYEVRRVLCQVQHQKIKVQTHNTAIDWHEISHRPRNFH